MISVTAIQEAQQSAVAAFEDFMDGCMDSEWQQVGPGGPAAAGKGAWAERRAAGTPASRILSCCGGSCQPEDWVAACCHSCIALLTG